MSPRSRGLLAALVTSVAVLTGCTTSPRQTPVPPGGVPDQTQPKPPLTCPDATISHAAAPGIAPGSTMARLVERGRLVIGVSSDAIPFGARNAINGDLEGFEIDLARSLAKAMLGDDSKLELRVIGLADLQQTVDNGDVDLAIRQVGMSCERWRGMRLSAPYASVGVRLLSRSNDPIAKDQVAGRTVCATRGSDAASLAATASATVVQEATDTACMVRFQRGEVSAVAGTAPVLAGLVRQDPYAKVSDVELGTVHLAVAVRQDRADLVRWINEVQQQRAGGAWAESWNRWVRPYAGEAQPPKPAYGRLP